MPNDSGPANTEDGFAILKELWDLRWSGFRDMPILVHASMTEQANRSRYGLPTGLEAGADDYIEKPICPDILPERIEKLTNRKRKFKLSMLKERSRDGKESQNSAC